MDTFISIESRRIAAEYRQGLWLNKVDEEEAGGFWDLAQRLATHNVPDIYGDNIAIDEQIKEIENRQNLIFIALKAVATGE